MNKITQKQISKFLCRISVVFQKEHAFDSDVEPHKFPSLPEMSNRSASDLSNLEVMLC